MSIYMYRPKQVHLAPSRGDVQGGASHLPLNSYDGIPHRAASRTKEPIPSTFLSPTVFYFTASGGIAYLPPRNRRLSRNCTIFYHRSNKMENETHPSQRNNEHGAHLHI